MGFFPDYTKAGPGIDKDAPKKKGVFLYFELVWRYLWKLVLSNMLYVAISLPILILYHYLFFGIFGTVYGDGASLDVMNHSALVFTVLLAVFWGTGPASCGYTHILRNMAREEHVWISLDFFKTAKTSFKHGLIFLIVDIAVFLTSMVSLSVYSSYAQNGSVLYLIPMGIVIFALGMYTLMHFFLYEFEVTFENKVKEIYKNSMLASIAAFPMCAIITVIICLLTYIILAALQSGIVIIASFIIWVGLMRFIIDFYTARFIKRHFLVETEESEK